LLGVYWQCVVPALSLQAVFYRVCVFTGCVFYRLCVYRLCVFTRVGSRKLKNEAI